jgi:hypothetical protein
MRTGAVCAIAKWGMVTLQTATSRRRIEEGPNTLCIAATLASAGSYVQSNVQVQLVITATNRLL